MDLLALMKSSQSEILIRVKTTMISTSQNELDEKTAFIFCID